METTEALSGTPSPSATETMPIDAAAGDGNVGVSDAAGHFTAGITDDSLREKYGRYSDLTAFAKAHDSLEKKLGEQGNRIALPGEDATPEDIQAFRQQIYGDAYPESADKYGIEMPTLPESVGPIPEETISGFLDVMHKAGAPAPVVQAALNYWGHLQSQAPELQRAEYEKIDQANRERGQQLWGSRDQENLRVGAEYIRRTHGDEALALLYDVGDNGNVKPTQGNFFLYEMANDLGRMHGHDRFVLGDGHGGFVRPEHASMEADKLEADHLAGRVSDDEFNRRMSELMRIADEGNVRAWGMTQTSDSETLSASVNG